MVLYITVKDQVIAKAQVHKVAFDYSGDSFGLKPINNGATEWKLFDKTGTTKKHTIDFKKPMQKKFSNIFNRNPKDSYQNINGIQVKTPSQNMQLDQVSEQLQHNQFMTFEFPTHDKVGSLDEGFEQSEMLNLIDKQYEGDLFLEDRHDAFTIAKDYLRNVPLNNAQTQNDLCLASTDVTDIVGELTGKSNAPDVKVDFSVGYMSQTSAKEIKGTYKSDPNKIGIITKVDSKSLELNVKGVSLYSTKTTEINLGLGGKKTKYSNYESNTNFFVGEDRRVFTIGASLSIEKSGNKSIGDDDNKTESSNYSFSTQIDDAQSGAYSRTSISWSDSDEEEKSKSKNGNYDPNTVINKQQMMRTDVIMPVPINF